jgi:hypothetical protein
VLFFLCIADIPFQTGQLQDVNIDSGKKTKKVLYTPVRGQFDQGNPDEYFDHQNRIITLENLGMNLPSKSSFLLQKKIKFFSDDNHVLINRYGCSVARRQVQENPPPPPPPKSELKGEFLS